INRADPIHSSSGHYAVMAAGTISLLLMVVVAALGARGFRVPAWMAGIGAFLLGALSIVGPADSSSLGIGAGAAAIGGGLVVSGLTEWHGRRGWALVDQSKVGSDAHRATIAPQGAVD